MVSPAMPRTSDLRRLFRSLRSRPSLTIMLGLGIGQGAVYAATPLIANLYTPSQVGVAGLFVAVSGALGSVGTLRLDQRIAACSNSEIAGVVRTALIIGPLVAIIGGLIWSMVLGGGLYAAAYFAVASAALGLTPLVSQLASRDRDFGSLATSKASAGLVQSGAHAFLGTLGFTGLGLLAGYAAGYSSGVAILWRKIVNALKMPAANQSLFISGRTLRVCLSFTFASLMNSLVVSAPPVLLATYYSVAEVGQFSIAQRIAVVPAGLAVAAIAPVVAADVGARLRSGESASPVVRRHLRKWSPVGAVVLIVPWLVPPALVQDALGREWRDVAYFMRALSPMIATMLVVGPVSQVLMLAGRGRTQLVWDASRCLAVALVATICAYVGLGATVMVASIVGVVVVYYLILARLVVSLDAPR